MSKSNYLENKLLDHALGTTAFTQPANQYLALHTASAGEAGTGTELTGTGYARASVTFSAACDGTAKAPSSGTIEFTNSGATSWPQVCYFGVWDCSSSTTNCCGNLLYYGSLTNGKTIEAGDTLRFTTESICITEN